VDLAGRHTNRPRERARSPLDPPPTADHDREQHDDGDQIDAEQREQRRDQHP